MINNAALPEPGPTRITVCPDGPLLIRGPVEIVDAAGRIIPRSRPTIALCRCGKSRLAPLCDGTHKLSNPRVRTNENPVIPDASGSIRN